MCRFERFGTARNLSESAASSHRRSWCSAGRPCRPAMWTAMTAPSEMRSSARLLPRDSEDDPRARRDGERAQQVEEAVVLRQARLHLDLGVRRVRHGVRERQQAAHVDDVAHEERRRHEVVRAGGERRLAQAGRAERHDGHAAHGRAALDARDDVEAGLLGRAQRDDGELRRRRAQQVGRELRIRRARDGAALALEAVRQGLEAARIGIDEEQGGELVHGGGRPGPV